jgi:hypothetical protein
VNTSDWLLSRRSLLVAALAAPACLTNAQRREDALTREARLWNDDYRWARWEQVVTLMPKDEAAALLARVELVRDELVIADSDFKSITFGSAMESAVVAVDLEWYNKRDMTVRHASFEQRWEYRDGQWLCIKLRRLRGDRFPLVTDPAVTPPVQTPKPAP